MRKAGGKTCPRSRPKKTTSDIDILCQGQAIGVQADQAVPDGVTIALSDDIPESDHRVPKIPGSNMGKSKDVSQGHGRCRQVSREHSRCTDVS